MANIKISQLTAASALDGSELFEVVQGGSNKKSTAAQIAVYVKSANGGGISGLTSGRVPYANSATTIIDSDIRVSSGNYGIGTTPTEKWHVYRGASDGVVQRLEGGTSGFSLYTSFDAAGVHLYTDSASRGITFGANSSLTDFQITSTGKVRLGVVPTNDNANTALIARDTVTGELETVASSTFQPSDAELTAIAGLVSAADRLPYFTGSGTASLATFTSFGRSLVDDANAGAALTTLGVSAFIQTLLDDVDAATARATLGLVIGTNVQAFDAELAAIAGLTSAADRLPYFTGSGTASLATFSSFARTLLDDSTAYQAITTLGLPFLRGSIVYNFPLLDESETDAVSLTVTGAAVGDIVIAGASPGMGGSVLLTGAVTSADTVTIYVTYVSNVVGSSVELPSTTFNVIVFQIP